MKKIISIALLFLLFCGTVSASSLNGDFEGNSIVKVKGNGSTLPVEDTPAINYNGRTLVPIYMLKQLGVAVTWNQDEYSVNVSLPTTSIKEQVSTVDNVRFKKVNGKLSAYSDFTKTSEFNADWEKILPVMDSLSKMLPDIVGINYVDSNNKFIASFEIDNKNLVDFRNGLITGEQLSKLYRVTGDLNSVPSSTSNNSSSSLTTKELAKLKDRVGYVIAFDGSQNLLGQGSGFMINPGIFITNFHVAGNTGGLRIQLDGTQYNTYGEYLFQNQMTDTFGVVIATQHDNTGKITGGYPTKTLEYTTILPEVGDKVYAIGSPKGLENTFSEGIVSSIRNIGGVMMIQHTANTDHGSSGGVLLNEKGQAIGITSSGYDGTSLDFAIPMMYVQQEIDKLNK